MSSINDASRFECQSSKRQSVFMVQGVKTLITIYLHAANWQDKLVFFFLLNSIEKKKKTLWFQDEDGSHLCVCVKTFVKGATHHRSSCHVEQLSRPPLDCHFYERETRHARHNRALNGTRTAPGSSSANRRTGAALARSWLVSNANEKRRQQLSFHVFSSSSTSQQNEPQVFVYVHR